MSEEEGQQTDTLHQLLRGIHDLLDDRLPPPQEEIDEGPCPEEPWEEEAELGLDRFGRKDSKGQFNYWLVWWLILRDRKEERWTQDPVEVITEVIQRLHVPDKIDKDYTRALLYGKIAHPHEEVLRALEEFFGLPRLGLECHGFHINDDERSYSANKPMPIPLKAAIQRRRL